MEKSPDSKTTPTRRPTAWMSQEQIDASCRLASTWGIVHSSHPAARKMLGFYTQQFGGLDGVHGVVDFAMRLAGLDEVDAPIFPETHAPNDQKAHPQEVPR